MKSTQTTSQSVRSSSAAFRLMLTATCLFVSLIFGNLSHVFAQATFMGDYDKTFAAPRGYFADPQDPDPTIDEQSTEYYTGDYAPDGSIIAGGRLLTTSNTVDFYIRKFTPTGAADTSFGLNGVVRTNFHSRFDGVPTYDTPIVLKVQPDGKILFAGQCPTLAPAPQTAPFGVDACVIRYNANGTLDQTFGGNLLVYTSQGSMQNQTTQIEPGKLIFQTGVISNGQSFGTRGTFHDIAIQPDGKIILVGETLNSSSFFAAQGYGAIVVRLNQNGTLDSTFGTNGIARWTAPQSGTCFPERRFFGVRLQADGRIVAVGHDGATAGEACFIGRFFAVTRWTANGQLETVRRLDNNTDVGQNERAVSAHFTRDGSKILVSGSYRNLSGTPAGRNKPTIIRLNTSDLSLDASFGSGGIVQSNTVGNSWVGSTLNIKAIQPDGKILAVDNAFINGTGVVRLNPDGSGDNSFGNTFYDQQIQTGRGRIRVFVTNFNGASADLTAQQILVRPNGRINLLGYSAAFIDLRAVVSQQNTSYASVQLSSATLTVNEGAGAATINVTRANAHAAETSFVNYVTNDDTRLFNCNPSTEGQPSGAIRGVATARCDYSSTVGTLQFNPGETTKAITIPISDDAHVEGAETFTISLRDPLYANLDGLTTTTVTIEDDDAAGQANPISGNPFFVRQHYSDFFGRSAAQSEIDAWTSVTGPDCPLDAPDNCYDRIWVSGKGFFFSPEFQQKGYYVYRFYKLLGRNRLPTYNEFVPDMVSIAGTSDPDKNSFATRFMARADYLALYPASQTNDQFVDTIIQQTGLTTLNAAQMKADLNANQKTRAQVLREVVESAEMTSREFNNAWVVMQYFGYLRRDGAASEYQGWLNVLNANPNNFRQMTNGFVNSVEYRQRFGDPNR